LFDTKGIYQTGFLFYETLFWQKRIYGMQLVDKWKRNFGQTEKLFC